MRQQSPVRHFSATLEPSNRPDLDRYADPASHLLGKQDLFDQFQWEQDWSDAEVERVTTSTQRHHLAATEVASTR